MESYEVLRNAIEKVGAKAVASDMQLSPALIYKWCQKQPDKAVQDQAGVRNPLDRVHELYELTKDIEIINCLCRKAGGFFVSNPSVTESRDRKMIKDTQKMIREFSELLEVVSKSIEDDGEIDATESKRIRKEWEDLKRIAESFVVSCEKGVFKQE